MSVNMLQGRSAVLQLGGSTGEQRSLKRFRTHVQGSVRARAVGKKPRGGKWMSRPQPTIRSKQKVPDVLSLRNNAGRLPQSSFKVCVEDRAGSSGRRSLQTVRSSGFTDTSRPGGETVFRGASDGGMGRRHQS
jgi:hypothetical protein